ELLEEVGQEEIISKLKKVSIEEQNEFVKQINELDKACRGGIKDYIKRAKILLEKSKNKQNSFHQYKIEVPYDIPRIDIGSKEFYELEELGFKEIKDSVFVLVAGGLGERLGYKGIKIGLQTELLTLRTYIELYIEHIKAYEDRIRKKENLSSEWFIPFCIMTSGDTNEGTISFLKEHSNFGMKDNQISLLKQDKLPAILDNDCHLALRKDKFLLETKPHGHGDIHYLLYKSGKAKKWFDEGKKYMIQFMDTNALAFNCVPSTVGVSVKYNYDVNSTVVLRRAQEKIGALCKLIDKDGKTSLANIEYNQLDSLFKEKYNGKGDIPNKEGFCDFPGNLNVLVFKLGPYLNIIEESKGLVPEFVNPKYVDDTRSKFKAPTRLETLMQDVPKLIKNNGTEGYTYFNRWFCFSACKNNLHDACERLKKGESAECAFSVEREIFLYNEKIMKEVIGKLEIINNEPPNELIIGDCKVTFGPKIIIYPSFAATVTELRDKLKHMKKNIKMTNNSTLILKNDVMIDEGIDLDGYLIVDKDLKDYVICKNKNNVIYHLLKEDEGKNYERIRGYTILEK
ncbi:MAG: UTP--glucose-1-phosphate uridylyltransferase, partial [Bacilli bacterium]|nr:UTP--glucose-1-phosphate uridylyltransferase [Bacilli bacterium]